MPLFCWKTIACCAPGGWPSFTERTEAIFRKSAHPGASARYLFPGCDFFFGPEDELLMLQRFSTWGWATWANRWRDYEADLKKVVDRFSERNLSIELFAEDMAYLARREDFLEGRKDIWSVPWILEHYLSSSFAIYPRESVIENIGLDGSGQKLCADKCLFTQTAGAQVVLHPLEPLALLH